MNRLKHYLTALSLLTAVSVIYQNTFVPLIQPVSSESIPMKPAQSLRVDASLTDLFPAGSWQRGSCKVLQTADGMLLFENWEQTSGDQWKLWPVSVVIGRGMSSKKSAEPMILEANEGAEIKFSASLDVMSGGAPPIERGRMIGPVHVFRKSIDDPTDTNADQRTFDLKTSNVGIDRRKIWTTDAITMQVGGAKLAGSDLTIHFAADPSKSHGNGHSIMDRMELFYLDQLTMPLGKASEDEGTVSILCNGRVEYDFALDHLTLSDSVSLVHQDPTGIVDRFDCDRLQLWLNDPTNESIVRSGPMDWVNKLVAVGDSSEGRPAAAELPTFDTSISADNILLDARAGKIRASGTQGIRLRRGAIWAGLVGIDYDFDPTRPQAIGTLSITGAGVVKIDDPKIAIKEARWQDSLRVRPRLLANLDQFDTDLDIHVEGDFSAEFIDGGRFSADKIHAILSPQPADSAITDPLPREPKSAITLVPSEFNVTGNVVVDTSALVAKTDFLRLLFVSEPDPNPRGQKLQPSQASTSPLRQWVSQPTPESIHDDRPVEVPPARSRPILRGDSIQAILRRNTSGLSAKSLHVEGNVKVNHSLSTADSVLPVELSADRLRLLDGVGDDVLELTSSPRQPARFDIGDGFFVGRTIQVRPSENMIWIPESGEFQIPTSVLPGGLLPGDNVAVQATTTNVRPAITWSRPPYCRWQGEMTFDGRSILLSGGIDITATMIRDREQWDFDVNGDRLDVRLLQNVSLSDISSVKSAQIESVAIKQSDQRPVLIKAVQRAGDGAMESKHLIRAAELTMVPGEAGLAQTAGRLVGAGPGWYRAWMRSNQSNRSGQTGYQADSTMMDDVSQPLTGVHLTFNRSIDADMLARRLRFGDGVRVGIKNVRHWDDVFSATEMNELGMDESTLDCEQLQLSLGPTSMPIGYGTSTMPWEIQALTGIVLRTRAERGLLETTANRASYAASKDLFTLQGSPKRPAIIKQFTPEGQLRINMAVKSAVVRPSTLTVESMEMESVNMAAPANLTRPRPGQFR
jgi:hypothetical protein